VLPAASAAAVWSGAAAGLAPHVRPAAALAAAQARDAHAAAPASAAFSFTVSPLTPDGMCGVVSVVNRAQLRLRRCYSGFLWSLWQVLWEAAFPEEPFHLPGLEPPCSSGSAAGEGPHTNGAAPAAAEPLCDSSGGGSSSSHGAAAGAWRGQHDAQTGLRGRPTCSYDIIAAAVRQFDFYWSVSAYVQEPTLSQDRLHSASARTEPRFEPLE
jgi:hypothetical protein